MSGSIHSFVTNKYKHVRSSSHYNQQKMSTPENIWRDYLRKFPYFPTQERAQIEVRFRKRFMSPNMEYAVSLEEVHISFHSYDTIKLARQLLAIHENLPFKQLTVHGRQGDRMNDTIQFGDVCRIGDLIELDLVWTTGRCGYVRRLFILSVRTLSGIRLEDIYSYYPDYQEWVLRTRLES